MQGRHRTQDGLRYRKLAGRRVIDLRMFSLVCWCSSMVEQPIRNRQMECSNPPAGSTLVGEMRNFFERRDPADSNSIGTTASETMVRRNIFMIGAIRPAYPLCRTEHHHAVGLS